MRLLHLLLLLLFLLSSCANHEPPPSLPKFSLPEKFSFSGEKEQKAKWWQEFQDPELNMLMQRAFTHNFSLLAAKSRIEQSRALYQKERSGLFPSLNAGAEAKNSWQNSASKDVEALSFSASYEIDLWGKINSLSQAARIDYQASKLEYQAAEITLSAQIANEWYQLCEERARHKLLLNQLYINQQGVEILKLKFRTGKIPFADLLQQQQLVEAKQGEIDQIKKQILLRENSLCTLLGTTKSSFTLPEKDQLPSLSPIPATGLPIKLITNRPDVQQAFKKVEASNHRLAAAIADRYPSISLSANLSSSNEGSEELFSNWLSSIAANLLLPVIDGGKRKSEVERQKAVNKEQLYLFSQKSLEAIVEVENALEKERQQQQYIQQVDKQYQLSYRAVLQIKDRYLKGSENYQRVLTALVSSQSLAQQQLIARKEAILYRIELCRALSQGWNSTTIL